MCVGRHAIAGLRPVRPRALHPGCPITAHLGPVARAVMSQLGMAGTPCLYERRRSIRVGVEERALVNAFRRRQDLRRDGLTKALVEVCARTEHGSRVCLAARVA